MRSARLAGICLSFAGATNAATTALFGRPQQTDGNAYVPRQAQLGFRIGF